MELLNTKTAIKKSKDIWGDYYNYSLFEYFDSKTPVILICPKHGEFTQIFNTHLRSSCFECGKEKRRKENIIDIFNKKHNNKYNYSKTIYLGNHKDILVICPIHGDFLINAGNHKNGNGCRECGIASQTIGVDKFIERSIDLHNNFYNYSKVEYIRSSAKVLINCPKHGDFEQSPNSHLNGYGCKKCLTDKNNNIKKESWIKYCNNYHNNYYDYTKVEYIKNNIKVCIICTKHGEFYQEPRTHLKHGCSICNESKGEKKISKILDKYNILYLREYKFKDCFYKKELPFDFYLPKHNICIEFNGKQHYESIEHFGGDIRLKEQIEKDNIRRSYCIINNIKLVEIKYDESIEEKINFIYEKEKV